MEPWLVALLLLGGLVLVLYIGYKLGWLPDIDDFPDIDLDD